MEPLAVYFCGSEQCAPGHFFGPAVRPHYLIHVVLQGTGIYQRKEQTYQLGPGDAFLISPLESTYYQADQEHPWKYAWVGFDGSMTAQVLESTCFAKACVYRCPDNSEAREAVLQQAVSVLKVFQRADHHSLTLTGAFLQLLGLMQSHEPAPAESYPKQYLAKAKEYMDNNYSYHIRISDIASFVGIDRTYLYRIFMEQEHISPKQYLFQLRIRKISF